MADKQLLSRIVQHAQENPQGIAFRFPTEKNVNAQAYTWASAKNEMARIAKHLSFAGVQSRTRVAIVAPSPREQIFAFLGTLAAGGIPTVLSYPTTYQSRTRFVSMLTPTLRASEASHVICSARFESEAEGWLAETKLNLRQIEFPEGDPGKPDGELQKFAAPADPLFLQYSSGTTGTRKGIAVTNAMLSGEAEAYGKAIGLLKDDRIASWLPHYHDLGLVGCFLIPAYFGAESIHISPFEWVENPVLLLEIISDYRATLVWLPNFAYNLLASRITAKQVQKLDLSSVRAFINGAEAVRQKTHDTFLEHFAAAGVTKEKLQVIYGMAEVVLSATQTTLGEVVLPDVIDRKRFAEMQEAVPAESETTPTISFMNCGKPIPGCEVRISGGKLGERQVGEIEVKCDWVFNGYLGGGRSVEDTFTEDGWYRSGDLGYLAEGHIYVAGRSKDMIIYRGSNIYPTDIENVIEEEIEGIRPGRVVAFGVEDEARGTEKIVVMAEAKSDDAGTELGHKIGMAVWRKLDVLISDVVFCERGKLIKSTSGKLSRSQNRALYKEMRGAFAPNTQTSGETSKLVGVANILQEIWQRALNLPSLGINARVFNELKAGSLETTLVASEIAKYFGVTVSPASLIGAETIAEQAKLVGRALNSRIEAGVMASLNPGEPPALPLFLVHGGDGHSFSYLRLVRAIESSRPVKALICPSLNPDEPFRSIPDLLNIYVEALLKEHGGAPFVLGGWSHGGLLAYDLAKLLTEAGEKVVAIVMFDTDPPNVSPKNTAPPMDLIEKILLGETSPDSPEGMKASEWASGYFQQPPTYRLIWGSRHQMNPGEVAKLARFTLGQDAPGIFDATGEEPEFEKLERLASELEKKDGELFRQTILPGQSGRHLHRACLVFKSNLIDSFASRDGWVFPGQIYNIVRHTNSGASRWQKYTQMPLALRGYDFQALACKTAHGSIMDEPNIELFAKELNEYLNSIDALYLEESRAAAG